MEEKIIRSIIEEEREILYALTNRLFDLAFELDEGDPRVIKIEAEARKLSKVCSELIALAEDQTNGEI